MLNQRDINYEKFDYDKICNNIDNEIDSVNQSLLTIGSTDSRILFKFIQDSLVSLLDSHHFDQAKLFKPILTNYSELLYIESILFFTYDSGHKEMRYASFLYLNGENDNIMHYYRSHEHYFVLLNPKKILDRTLYKRLKRSIKAIFEDNFKTESYINPTFINYFEGNLKSFLIVTKIGRNENFCRVLFNPSAIKYQNNSMINNNDLHKITQMYHHIENMMLIAPSTYDWEVKKDIEDSLNFIHTKIK